MQLVAACHIAGSQSTSNVTERCNRSIKVSGLDAGVPYYFVVRAYNNYYESKDSNELVYIGAVECFAEKIYGEDSKEVAILKKVRDTILSATPEGQEIIKLYYQWCPAITMAI